MRAGRYASSVGLSPTGAVDEQARRLACRCARAYLTQREAAGFPLLDHASTGGAGR